MINKACPLTDKKKLKIVLHSSCPYQELVPNSCCYDCCYEVPTLEAQIIREVQTAIGNYLFEPNNDNTKQAIVADVSSHLSVFTRTKRILDYNVVCDNTNNNPASNICNIAVYVKPVASVNFLCMHFAI
jgi:hypothetical protein